MVLSLKEGSSWLLGEIADVGPLKNLWSANIFASAAEYEKLSSRRMLGSCGWCEYKAGMPTPGPKESPPGIYVADTTASL